MIDGLVSPPRRNWRGKVVKEELPTAITKARKRILHHLGRRRGSGSLSSGAIVSAENKAARQAAQQERRNTVRHSAFAKSDKAAV